MIRLQNIEKIYRTDTVETLALSRINLNIAKGEFLSVMGPSGCGKSTLLNIIGLLDIPSIGEIEIEAQTTEHFSDRQLAHFRNKMIGFIFQSYHLINDLRVLDNVELPLLYRKSSAKERNQLATAALEKVGLSNRAKHFPSQLSGGQKQRVMIAMALSCNPSVLIADEPTGNLDPETSLGIMQLLYRINKTGTTVVMATHDREMVDRMRRRVIALDEGRVVRDQKRGGYGED